MKEKKEKETKGEAKKDTKGAEAAEAKKEKPLTKSKKQFTSDGFMPKRKK